jgi:trans-aconitate methyltransferase
MHLLPAIPFAGWADVVFSTATFHWVRNHPALFTNISARSEAAASFMPNAAEARTSRRLVRLQKR